MKKDGTIRGDASAPYRNRELMYQKYIVEGRSIVDTAISFGASPSTTLVWLRRLGIKTRNLQEGVNTKRYREKKAASQLGEKNWKWNGGKTLRPIGKTTYCLVLRRSHPNADPRGYIYEHRLIMEKYLGRYLEPQEVVHHINGTGTDNRLENLQLTTFGEHMGIHNSWRKMIPRKR